MCAVSPKPSVSYPFPCHILMILLPSFNPCCRWACCWHLRPTNHGAYDTNDTRSLMAVLALSCTLTSFTKLYQGRRWPRLLRCHHAQGLLAARHCDNEQWAPLAMATSASAACTSIGGLRRSATRMMSLVAVYRNSIRFIELIDRFIRDFIWFLNFPPKILIFEFKLNFDRYL
jgi:hypothetical protein